MNFSLIGQKAILINPQFEGGKLMNFSSTLDKIGKEWDRSFRNHIHVEIISDPFTIKNHELYGDLEVIKVMEFESEQEFWAPLMHLKIESKFSC